MGSEYKLPPILQHIQSLGYRVFEDGAYNLNLFGIRSPERVAGKFDDWMGCAYRETDDGPWRVAYWPATTDPGAYYLDEPLNVAGTAILVEGQYRGAYEIGLHRGKYTALVQTGNAVKVYRDDNRDEVLDLDPDTTAEGYFGINLHASSQTNDGTGESTNVGRWSAGCNVHGTQRGFDDMMRLAALQIETHPTWAPRFTYTLVRQWWED
jgi:hypothetical protein